jgi:hypothetical protein
MGIFTFYARAVVEPGGYDFFHSAAYLFGDSERPAQAVKKNRDHNGGQDPGKIDGYVKNKINKQTGRAQDETRQFPAPFFPQKGDIALGKRGVGFRNRDVKGFTLEIVFIQIN